MYLLSMLWPLLFPSFFLQVATRQKYKFKRATSKMEIKRAETKNDEQEGKVININNKNSQCSETESIL